MQPRIDQPFVIKICGITTEEDARVAVGEGANALGFNFYRKSPRYVSMQRAQEIVEAVPGDYLTVGIFVNPALEEAEGAPLDVVQVHGSRCPRVSRRVWKAIAPAESTEQYPWAEAYLVDTPSAEFGGTGRTFDWTLARRDYRVIVAGGLDASNIAEAIAAAEPWGVDACSRLESGPGRKDPIKVRAFVSAARRAFASLLQQETHL